MSATHRRLRWWQWLGVAVLLIVTAQVAWRYRPLSAMERRLLGTWDIRSGAFDGFITFTADRRFTFLFRGRSPTVGIEIPDIAGSWSASEPRLRYTYDSPYKDFWRHWKREWALLVDGKSRTSSVALVFIQARGPWEDDFYQSTDPSASVTLKPVSAIDRSKWGFSAQSLKPEPQRP